MNHTTNPEQHLYFNNKLTPPFLPFCIYILSTVIQQNNTISLFFLNPLVKLGKIYLFIPQNWFLSHVIPVHFIQKLILFVHKLPQTCWKLTMNFKTLHIKTTI